MEATLRELWLSMRVLAHMLWTDQRTRRARKRLAQGYDACIRWLAASGAGKPIAVPLTPALVHPKRRHIHAPGTLGDYVADRVALAVGSWRFVLGQAALMMVWFILNTLGGIYHWDNYPFVFLNLAMSAEAAFATPIILMSQNRQSQKDRLRDDHEAREVDQLFTINRQQLEILRLLHQLAEGNGNGATTTPPIRPVTASPDRHTTHHRSDAGAR